MGIFHGNRCMGCHSFFGSFSWYEFKCCLFTWLCYAGLIADLKIANEKIDGSVTSIPGDIMFKGSALLWKKFFNSLRFKLLNRQVHKVPGSAAVMQAMIDDPATI